MFEPPQSVFSFASVHGVTPSFEHHAAAINDVLVPTELHVMAAAVAVSYDHRKRSEAVVGLLRSQCGIGIRA